MCRPVVKRFREEAAGAEVNRSDGRVIGLRRVVVMDETADMV